MSSWITEVCVTDANVQPAVLAKNLNTRVKVKSDRDKKINPTNKRNNYTKRRLDRLFVTGNDTEFIKLAVSSAAALLGNAVISQ